MLLVMEVGRRVFISYFLFWLIILVTKGDVSIENKSYSSVHLSPDNLPDDTHERTLLELKRRNLNCTEDILTENEYILLENGSLLLPQNQHLYGVELYVIQNDTAYICASDRETEAIEKAEATSDYNFSKEFLSCGHILIDPHQYILRKNGTVYIEIYHKSYEPSDYYIQEKGVYICIPNFTELRTNSSDPSDLERAKFSIAFVYVSLVGLSISIISLLLHLIVFCCVSKVRNLPGCCLASLSVSLLFAYLCFVSSSAVANQFQCANLGLSIYYFFLTSFFWMNVIAFDVWRSFRVVLRELRISSYRIPWRRFLLYSVYSWLTPAMLVTLAKVADTTDILPEDYRPSFGSHSCWFGQRKALLVFFAAPLCVIMGINAIFFLDSSYIINMATIKTSQIEKAMMKRRFFMFMRLALLMGLTWIIGIIAGYVDQEVLWYIFVVLNTLQGLFIFIVFSCSSKVRMFFMRRSRVNKRQSTSVRTISQVSGAL